MRNKKLVKEIEQLKTEVKSLKNSLESAYNSIEVIKFLQSHPTGVSCNVHLEVSSPLASSSTLCSVYGGVSTRNSTFWYELSVSYIDPYKNTLKTICLAKSAVASFEDIGSNLSDNTITIVFNHKEDTYTIQYNTLLKTSEMYLNGEKMPYVDCENNILSFF